MANKIIYINNKKATIDGSWLMLDPGLRVLTLHTVGNETVTASQLSGYPGDTATLVPGTSDVYDVYKSGTNFERLLRGSNNVIEVLGANTSGVTNMEAMFYACTLLPNVPLFDTSSVTDMMYTFHNCINVQSGALTLYQQVSTQAKPPTFHTGTFMECGSNTQTGAAELAQIPSNWK